MMNQKQRYVFDELESGDVCVFPSEVSARSWLLSYAAQSGRGAIFSDRAISYDTFQGLFLPLQEGERLATPLTRLLFVQQAVSQGLGLDYFFSSVPEESKTRIARYLSTILPQLKDVVMSKAFSHLDGRLQRDYQALYHAYGAFLSEHKIIEPTYGDPVVPKEHGRYRVLFSNAQLGFSRLYGRLGKPDWVKPVPTEEPGKKPDLLRYGNHVEEIRDTMRKIRSLLDDGVPARDIVLSVARERVMFPRLATEADRYDVPLVIHGSTSPLSYPAGRFFRQLQELYQEEFDYQNMESFLLEPGIPWKNRERTIHQDLLNKAIELSVDRGSQGNEDDMWLGVLARADKTLGDWYREFKKMIRTLNTAKSMMVFYRALQKFQDDYFLESKWEGFPGEELERFCIDHLETMREEMASCGMDEAQGGYLSQFVSYLEKLPYAPQEKGKKGIDVYRWTDSAAVSSPHHFLICLDHEASQRLVKPMDCLPETVDHGMRDEEDLTKGTLDMAVQDDAVVSYHESDYQGEYLASPYFDKVVDVHSVLEDPYQDEQRLWAGKGTQGSANRYQQASLRVAMGTSLRRVRHEDFLSFSHCDASPSCVSATQLDRFVKCPFSWALDYLLDIKRTDWDVGVVPSKEIGNIVHKTFELFFGRIKVFRAVDMAKYRPLMASLFDQALNEVYGERGPNPFVREWILTYKEKCIRFLDAEKESFNDTETAGIEEKLEARWGTLVLEGKIDRVVKMADGSYAVIDYKSGKKVPMKPGSKEFTTLQLPLYDYLLEKKGKEVSRAGYYSLEEGKYLFIWDESHPRKDEGRAMLDITLEDFSSHLASGNYETSEDSDHCQNCIYRPICRRRYSTL